MAIESFAVFVGDDQRHLGDAADAHDCRVRLIDDRQAEDRAELAGVGNGEGRAFDFFRLELFVAGALAEVGDAALQAQEVQFVGVLEHGDDQSPVERDRDADIYVPVIANAIAFERSVHDRELLQADDRRAHEKWHEGQARAVALLESGLQLVAEIDDAGHVHFEHAVDVRAGAARLDHALRDDAAHVGHGNQVAGNGGGSRARGRRSRRASIVQGRAACAGWRAETDEAPPLGSDSINASMSCLVILPPRPVPST